MNNKVKFLRGTSNEYAIAEKDNDTIYFTTDDGKLYIGDKEVLGGGSITIDDALSDTSENAVQNKIISTALGEKALKTLYSDTTINVGRKPDTTVGDYSTAEGHETTASGASSHAEGFNTIASAASSHAEGSGAIASGLNSHAEGVGTLASGFDSHAEGVSTTASGLSSHAEGNSSNSVISIITDFSSSTTNNDIINAWNSDSFSLAKGDSSHIEGADCLALGDYSHAEGYKTTASSDSSHAEGTVTTASGNSSHAGGWFATAAGKFSFAHGYAVNTSNENEVAFGSYNTSNADTLFSIGDGTSINHHNAFEVTTNGGTLHGNNIITTAIIDDVLSETSENPVKNKVIYAALKGGGSYELPIATTEILGGVMPDGTTITVDENGVISAVGSGEGGGVTIDSALSETSENPVQNKIITSALNNKAESNHVHSYAGSSSEGGSATSAVKLDSSAGSTVNPVYFSEGKPVACTYTLGKSVPNNAVFTDTVYTLPKATTSVLGGVKVDGTTIAVDSNGVISTAGGLTVDTLLDITVSKGSTSNSYGSCNPAEGSIITLTGNMTDYKLLQFIEVYDSGISPTRAPITIDLSIVGWDSYINRTLALGSVYGVLQYYYVSPNQIKLSYLINQNSNSGRLLIVGIK